MDDSEDAVVRAADTALTKAKAAVNKVSAAERATLSRRLGDLESDLIDKKSTRTIAINKEAMKVYDGIARYNDKDGVNKRHVAFSDLDSPGGGNSKFDPNATLNLSIGTAATVKLKRDKTATVAAHKGWQGSKYTLEEGGTTYEAVAYYNRYDDPNGLEFFNRFTFEQRSGGWVTEEQTEQDDNRPKLDGEYGAGVTRLDLENYSPLGSPRVEMKGTLYGVRGTFSCMPKTKHTCAVRLQEDAPEYTTLGGASEGLAFNKDYAVWRFKPDNLGERIAVPDRAFVSYGYWIRKMSDGRWDVSAFHDAKRGRDRVIENLTRDTGLISTATYEGGAAGVYALSGDAGKFTANAELVADFDTDSVTVTINEFMTESFLGGDSRERDWSVALQKKAFSDDGTFAGDADGLTRWTMDGTAAPAAGKWEGAFYERNVNNNYSGFRPKAATGSFYAEHGTSSRMVGAFGVQDPNREEQ